MQELAHISLSEGHAKITCRLEPPEQFSTGSLFKEFFRTTHTYETMGVWKARMQAKIKIIYVASTSK